MYSLCEKVCESFFEGALMLKEVVSLCVLATLEGLGSVALVGVAKRLVLASFTCILAVGGAIVGAIHGALKGQTTEIGFATGAGVGGLAGAVAVAAIQLMDSVGDGHPLCKINTMESSKEISELYDITGEKGLSQECIQNLPQSTFCSGDIVESSNEIFCFICLQELKDGEYTRELPTCKHLFHLACIDLWLRRQGSCPMCRVYVADNTRL